VSVVNTTPGVNIIIGLELAPVKHDSNNYGLSLLLIILAGTEVSYSHHVYPFVKSVASSLLLHKPYQVTVGIPKKTQPEFVVGHLGSELRGALAFTTAADDSSVYRFDIRNGKIQDRISTDGTCTLRSTKHQAHAIGVQKSELGAGAEQELQPQHVPIKDKRFFHVTNGNGYLTDVG